MILFGISDFGNRGFIWDLVLALHHIRYRACDLVLLLSNNERYST
jgi:hypothetical protein